MDSFAVNLLLKDILSVLSNPLINIDEVKDTFQFIEKELFPLYQNEKNIVDALSYYNSMLNELFIFDERYNNNKVSVLEEQIQDLTLISDKYLCITDINKDFLQSKFVIVEYITKTMIHLVWRRLYENYYEIPLTLDNIVKASELYKELIGDIISKLKKCDIINI